MNYVPNFRLHLYPYFLTFFFSPFCLVIILTHRKWYLFHCTEGREREREKNHLNFLVQYINVCKTNAQQQQQQCQQKVTYATHKTAYRPFLQPELTVLYWMCHHNQLSHILFRMIEQYSFSCVIGRFGAVWLASANSIAFCLSLVCLCYGWQWFFCLYIRNCCSFFFIASNEKKKK